MALFAACVPPERVGTLTTRKYNHRKGTFSRWSNFGHGTSRWCVGVYGTWAKGGSAGRFRPLARSTWLWFSPDGQILASWATASGTPSEATLWDPGTSRRLLDIPGITGYVISLTFVDEGRGLVVLEHDLNDDSSKNRLVSWNLRRAPESLAPGAPAILCSKVAYSKDGGWLATGSTDGDVILSDAATGGRSRPSPSLSLDR